MVNFEKRKVVLRSRSGKKSDKAREIDTQVCDYGDSRIAGTNIVVSVAVATFCLKSEDRHQVLRLGDDEEFRTCQKKLRCEPLLAAFVGVYDGHDGDFASEYCSKGLVPHILAELTPKSAAQRTSRWSLGPDRAMAPLTFETQPEESNSNSTDMDIPYIAAFKNAHDRFANKLDPPTLEEVCKQGPLKVAPPTNYNPISWMASSATPQRGGTTACTLSVFTELGEDLPQVVVANTGDSRMITDDATGSHRFRQITTDHRPSNPEEKKRLTEYVARGDTYMHRSSDLHDMRIFPGGLAVSRTIGDISASRSVICTPEVIDLPLKIKLDNAEEKTQRFVLGSDGLFDVLTNDEVGKAAARKPLFAPSRTSSSSSKSRSVSPNKSLANGDNKDGNSPPRQQQQQQQANGNRKSGSKKESSPKAAATKILQQCLEAGGNRDDVTICVVDVSFV